MLIVLAVGWSFGCSFGLTPVVKDPSSIPLQIGTIVPAFGPPGGGTEVIISGSGFAADTTVTFDDRVGSVTVLDASTLLVVTPGIRVELDVDVTVASSNGTDTVVDGFSFRRGGGGDSGGGDGSAADTADYAGMVGGYALFELSVLACATCASPPATEPPSVAASAVFHAPARGSWLSWVPPDESCLPEVSRTPLATTSWNAGTTIVLSDGSQDVVLSSTSGSGGVSYAASALTTANWAPDGQWQVAGRGGADVAAFRLDGLLVTPSDFFYIQPSGLLAESTKSAWAVPFGASAGTTITWAPYNIGDFVLVTLEASGRSATCRSADDGTMLIPASTVTGWSNGTQLTVRIARYSLLEGVLPDGSTLEAVGSIERVGTGYVSY